MNSKRRHTGASPPNAADTMAIGDFPPVDGPAAEKELAKLARALGHRARIRIIRLLASRGRCSCGEIVDELPFAQSTVSQHLKALKNAGLISAEEEGPRMLYRVDDRVLRRFRALAAVI